MPDLVIVAEEVVRIVKVSAGTGYRGDLVSVEINLAGEVVVVLDVGGEQIKLVISELRSDAVAKLKKFIHKTVDIECVDAVKSRK